MKYDDVSWHCNEDFPSDLPHEAGAIHIGMFLAWALLSGLGGYLHTEEFPGELEQLRQREITPGQFFMNYCDGKFTDEDLNQEGNAFTQSYFHSQDGDYGQYIDDYLDVFSKTLSSIYHVIDTWQNFEKLRSVLDQRFAEWKNSLILIQIISDYD